MYVVGQIPQNRHGAMQFDSCPVPRGPPKKWDKSFHPRAGQEDTNHEDEWFTIACLRNICRFTWEFGFWKEGSEYQDVLLVMQSSMTLREQAGSPLHTLPPLSPFWEGFIVWGFGLTMHESARGRGEPHTQAQQQSPKLLLSC